MIIHIQLNLNTESSMLVTIIETKNSKMFAKSFVNAAQLCIDIQKQNYFENAF